MERAFRDMKSPLMERPIFHHLQDRVQTHISLCLPAYPLLVAMEKYFLDRGVHTSWWTTRRRLATHQVVTLVLPTADGSVLRIRKGTTPDRDQRDIYQVLHVPLEVIRPVETWHAGAAT